MKAGDPEADEMDLARERRVKLDEAMLDMPVRFSHLRAYGRSPMHGQLARRKDSEQTTAMQRGSAVHALVLGTRKVVAYPGAVRRGKDYESFMASNTDAEVLTQTEFEKVVGMAVSVENCALAKPFLQGTIEQTIMFRWNGLNCRATPDVRGSDFLTELKTSASSEPVKFTWQAIKQHYHAQMRMQQIACKDEIQRCYIVCVESSEPYPVTVFSLDKRSLEMGEKLLVLWSERLKVSEQSDFYPPYVQSIFDLVVPDDVGFEYGGEDD